MSKSDPTTNKTKPKSYRLKKPVLDSIVFYKEQEGISETRAIEELISLGITVYLQKLYNGEK